MSAPVHTPTTVEFSADKTDYQYDGSSMILLVATAPNLKFCGIGNASGLAPNGLEICVQNAGEYAVTIPHASSLAAAGTRFAIPNATDIVLEPAADPSENPLGECVYSRLHEGVNAPWSAQL